MRSGEGRGCRVAVLAGVFACLPLVQGCAFGPRVLVHSHGRFSDSVRRVDDEELLRNIVHMRYTESPMSLDVASIAAQYELSGGAEATPFFEAPNPSGNGVFRTFTSILPNANVNGANRPTISLIPDDDGRAVRRFLTPITGDTLIILSRTSWPVSTIVRLWVERLNGVPNGVIASGPQRQGTPDFARFRRAVDLMQAVQDRELVTLHSEEKLVEASGLLPARVIDGMSAVEAAKHEMEYRPQGDGTAWSLLRKQQRLVLDVSPAASGDPDVEELLALLNLERGRPRYEVTFSTSNPGDPLRTPRPPSKELTLSLRSTAQAFFYLANGVEVPAEHVACGLVRPPLDFDDRPVNLTEITDSLFRVHSCRGHKRPPCAYVAVKYRGYWFYIDDRDQESKATFLLMNQLARLDFGRQQLGGPLLTLPVGR